MTLSLYKKLQTYFAFLLIFLTFSHVALAEPITLTQQSKKISLDLRNANTKDTLQLLGKFLGINLIISPSITGTTTLYVHDISAAQALEMLLQSNGLGKLQMGELWLIAPNAEILQKKQEALKTQEAVDNAQPLVTRVWQIHFARANDIALLLQDNTHSLLSSRGHVHVDLRTNSLFVQDNINSLQQIHTLLEHLDTPVQQVRIEARLTYIDSDYERELGISFNSKQAADANSQAGDNTYQVDLPAAASRAATFSLAAVKLADGTLLDMELSALESEGRGTLVSSPSLITANQQTASIESGEEIPYQEISRSGGTGVTFKKAVLSLKVTPQIMPDDKILLQLQVNQDKPGSRTVLGVPAIDTRQIMTNVLLKNGQTVVLGGIYETSKQTGEHRIPFLGTLPIVGWLFKQQNIAANKRELLIFVTPKIV